MRKCFLTLSITVLLSILMMISGCGETAPSDGGEMELFSLLPDNADGVIAVNFKKMAQLDFFDEMVKEADQKQAEKPGLIFKNYQDFVDKTGIDPKKDIHGMAVGLYGELGAGEPDVVMLARLNYNQTNLLNILKEKAPGFAEETYEGVGFYKFKNPKGQDMALSFIGDNIIAAGQPDFLKKTIDIHKGKGQSIVANETMKPYFKKIKSGAIASFIMEFPEKAKQVQDSGMFKMDLTKAEAIIGYFDYESKTWTGEIQLISHNEEGNQQLVSTLNGLKMMAGAGGPEFAELVENVDLKATADSIKLRLSITDDLMKKLKTKISGAMTPPVPTETETGE